MMRQKEERTWFDEKDILHYTTFLLHLSIVFILIWCTYKCNSTLDVSINGNEHHWQYYPNIINPSRNSYSLSNVQLRPLCDIHFQAQCANNII